MDCKSDHVLRKKEVGYLGHVKMVYNSLCGVISYSVKAPLCQYLANNFLCSFSFSGDERYKEFHLCM